MNLDDITDQIHRLNLYKVGGSSQRPYRWRCLLLLENFKLIETEADTPERAIQIALDHMPGMPLAEAL